MPSSPQPRRGVLVALTKKGATMAGWTDAKVEEEIFREYLEGMNDAELSRVARHYVFLCQTSLGGPWKIDVWKRDFVHQECSRRQKPKLYQQPEEFILNSLIPSR